MPPLKEKQQSSEKYLFQILSQLKEMAEQVKSDSQQSYFIRFLMFWLTLLGIADYRESLPELLDDQPPTITLTPLVPGGKFVELHTPFSLDPLFSHFTIDTFGGSGFDSESGGMSHVFYQTSNLADFGDMLKTFGFSGLANAVERDSHTLAERLDQSSEVFFGSYTRQYIFPDGKKINFTLPQFKSGGLESIQVYNSGEKQHVAATLTPAGENAQLGDTFLFFGSTSSPQPGSIIGEALNYEWIPLQKVNLTQLIQTQHPELFSLAGVELREDDRLIPGFNSIGFNSQGEILYIVPTQSFKTRYYYHFTLIKINIDTSQPEIIILHPDVYHVTPIQRDRGGNSSALIDTILVTPPKVTTADILEAVNTTSGGKYSFDVSQIPLQEDSEKHAFVFGNQLLYLEEIEKSDSSEIGSVKIHFSDGVAVHSQEIDITGFGVEKNLGVSQGLDGKIYLTFSGYDLDHNTPSTKPHSHIYDPVIRVYQLDSETGESIFKEFNIDAIHPYTSGEVEVASFAQPQNSEQPATLYLEVRSSSQSNSSNPFAYFELDLEMLFSDAP